jgi:hypothetical protein
MSNVLHNLPTSVVSWKEAYGCCYAVIFISLKAATEALKCSLKFDSGKPQMERLNLEIVTPSVHLFAWSKLRSCMMYYIKATPARTAAPRTVQPAVIMLAPSSAESDSVASPLAVAEAAPDSVAEGSSPP